MFTQNTAKEEKMPVIDVQTPINLKLSAIFKRSFAYFTVKERLPVIITKIIDQLSRDREDITQLYGPRSEPDVRSAMSYLVHLRNEIMTNKPIVYFTSNAADVKAWNKLIEEQNHPYYFTAVWLFTECYVYRRIKEAFELTSSLKSFDPFRKQKEQQFISSIESMCFVADEMVSTWIAIGGGSKTTEHFISLLKVCLWSNKCDLSLSAGAEVATMQNPIQFISAWEGNIIINDIDKLLMNLRTACAGMQQFKKLELEMPAKTLVAFEENVFEKMLKENSNLPDPSTDDQSCVCARPIAGKNTSVAWDSTSEDAMSAENSSNHSVRDSQMPESDGPVDSEPDTVSKSVQPSPGDLPSNKDKHSTTNIDHPAMEDPVKIKKPHSHIIIDIVCDNAGYELFTDFCLADFLITKGFCSKVRFRLKAFPWFVSDATMNDFLWIINSCCTVDSMLTEKSTAETMDDVSDSTNVKEMLDKEKSLRSENLVKLGLRWKNYVSDRLFEPVVDAFWTTAHDFSELRKVDPVLYQSLSEAIFIFFKGDLNYRKLMGEKNWNPTTSFTKALQGFHPSPICTIRTVKADLICGLKEGDMARLNAKDEKWMERGDYGLIQTCNKVSKLSPEELEPDAEDI